jgi:hypothetical protein
MSRQFKIALLVLFVGAAVLGTIFAQKGKPPAAIPLAVIIYDEPNMVRSDTGGEYVNGIDLVTATVDSQYGELYFAVPDKSPRRVLLQFEEASKASCSNGCQDGSGKPALPPGPGEVNSFIFATYNRDGFLRDYRRDFLHMIPWSTGQTNIRLQILSPKYATSGIHVDYLRACADLTQIGYIFFAAGADHNGDGYADEWDLYPVPTGYPFSGDMAHVWLNLPGNNKKCSFGRYVLPFMIHVRKI